MGKKPKLLAHVQFGYFDDKGLVLLGCRVFFLNRFVFGSSSVNVGFGFFIDGIGKMFPWWSSVMD